MSQFHRMVYVEWDDPFASRWLKIHDAAVCDGTIDPTKRETCGFVIFDTPKFLVLTSTRGSYPNGDVESLKYICKDDVTKIVELNRGKGKR
jgi:hypothetical protein